MPRPSDGPRPRATKSWRGGLQLRAIQLRAIRPELACAQWSAGIRAAQSPLAGGQRRRRAPAGDWRRLAVGGGRRGCVMEAPRVPAPGVASPAAAALRAPATPEEQPERRARRRCAEGRAGLSPRG